VLLKRLSLYAEDLLPEAQCGFFAGEDTVDMIFFLKQIQEDYVEPRM
jgi:hypothetical protein